MLPLKHAATALALLLTAGAAHFGVRDYCDVGTAVSGSSYETSLSSPPPGVPGHPEWEEIADDLSRDLQRRHLPFGTVLDPVFASPRSRRIVGYSRAGDSAIWTGHYLAAEAFRFAVTGSPDALRNARRALDGIRSLVDVTGLDLLARAIVPVDDPYAAGILSEEKHHGFFRGVFADRKYYWIGKTSRDQYSGVFFGLGVAWELIDDRQVRQTSQELITRLLDRLIERHWWVVMPGGRIATLFHLRPEQQLALLQIGRRVNPERFSEAYRQKRSAVAGFVPLALAADLLDDHSRYFQFNLDSINLFHLLGLEEPGRYRSLYDLAYDLLRRTTSNHPNAHFHLIDHALRGPDVERDVETVRLLAAWLRRPRRDQYIDLRGEFAACGDDRACEPLPVERWVRTDFLWQRSPFLLLGGSRGTIEGAGIDFLLPYWMARYYGVL